MNRSSLVVTCLVLSAAGCSGSGGGGGSGQEGPLALRDVVSPDGGRTIAAAECLGFSIAANEDGVAFAPDATATLGSLPIPITFVSETELRAGAEETGGACFFLPVFPEETGDLTLAVTSAAGSWERRAAITLEPLDALDVGLVEKDRVWSSGEFEHAFDADVFRATFTDAYHVYDDVDFFPSGGSALVPEMQIWSAEHPDSYLGRGGIGLVFPQSGEQLVVVRDASGVGGTDAAYDVGFAGDELGSVDPADRCNGAPEIGARAIHVDYDELSDDFDPDGSCVDSLYGTPIVGRGKDAVWRVEVPAGAELRVSSYDDHLNSVLWIMDPADGCPRKPACLAAAGRFGGGNTDTLTWTNTGDAAREVLLVHDAEREPELEEGEDEVGSFLLDVEIFEAE